MLTGKLTIAPPPLNYTHRPPESQFRIMAPLSANLEAFTCFPLLPLELRRKIWKDAQPFRLITVEAHRESLHYQQVAFHSSDPPPNLLSVNHEAREETLRSYVVVYDITNLDRKPRFYFNSMRDTIYLDQPECPWYHVVSAIDHSISMPEARVRNLAIQDGAAIPHHDTQPTVFYQPSDREVTCVVQELSLVSCFLGGGHWRFISQTGEESDFDRSDVRGQVARGLREAKEYFHGGIVPVVRTIPKSYRDRVLRVEDLDVH
jgi:hypothetical protein